MGILDLIWDREYRNISQERKNTIKEYTRLIDEVKFIKAEEQILDTIMHDIRSKPMRPHVQEIKDILEKAKDEINNTTNIMVAQNKILRELEDLLPTIKKSPRKVQIFHHIMQQFSVFREAKKLEALEATQIYDEISLASTRLKHLKNIKWIEDQFLDNLIKYMNKMEKNLKIIKHLIQVDTKTIYLIASQLESIYKKQIKAFEKEEERKLSQERARQLVSVFSRQHKVKHASNFPR